MVEIFDETPALNDPLFLEIWEGINLKEQLEEAHRQLSIAHSMPETVKRTYLTLIDGFRKEMEGWFVEEPPEDVFQKTYDQMEEIKRKVEGCTDAMEALELQREFTNLFGEIMKGGELELRYPQHWDGLERRSRELLRVLQEYLRDGSARICEMNEEIRKCEEHYESLRFGIVRNAEAEIADRMTRRYQKMRLDFLKGVAEVIQQKHTEAYRKRMDAYMGEVLERRRNRQRANNLKAELSKLRVRYYTEPVEMERNLNVFRNQVLENDQTIALLQSELKHLQDEAGRVEPVSSLKPEVSARQTPIYDIPLVENELPATDVRKRLEEAAAQLSELRVDTPATPATPENDLIFIDVPPQPPQ